jgi:hypothetical protein
MGAPFSGLKFELFLQNIEHLYFKHLKTKLKTIEYFRYVDDIFLIYDSNHTNIQTKHNDFNAIHHNLEFTAEIETDNSINFLDINIRRNASNWNISIYRKPTFTDTFIPYSSNHPTQHKFAAVRFLHNRLNTSDLSTEAYELEKQTVQNILANNSFRNGLLNTSSIKKDTQSTRPARKTKMGHLHIHSKRNNLHHEHFQENKHKYCIPHTKHDWKQANAKTQDTWHICTIRHIQTHLPHM